MGEGVGGVNGGGRRFVTLSRVSHRHLSSGLVADMSLILDDLTKLGKDSAVCGS